jgi:uncharacterized protein YutE (UPF0331/DUF86 family)
MNKSKILKKLEYLKERLVELEERFKKFETEKKEFERRTLKLALSKLVEEIIESGIKINNFLLEEKGKYASTYYETFIRLKENFKFDKNFIEKISKTTRLRNKTVHEYEMVDKEERLEKEIPNLILLYKEYITKIKMLLKL